MHGCTQYGFNHMGWGKKKFEQEFNAKQINVNRTKIYRSKYCPVIFDALLNFFQNERRKLCRLQTDKLMHQLYHGNTPEQSFSRNNNFTVIKFL